MEATQEEIWKERITVIRNGHKVLSKEVRRDGEKRK